MRASLVVVHPGFLLGRKREEAIAAVVEQLGELHERLDAKGRIVPLGVEIMGRVRELGSRDDVLEIASQLGWVQHVLDFAHLHTVTGGGVTGVEAFARVLAAADGVLEAGTPFHINFSDISFANRNERPHLA